jgi:hypothetical protein
MPTHIRATYGHDRALRIRPADLFGAWSQFQWTSTPALYSGPRYIYHYTKIGALEGIARAVGLVPGGLGTSKGSSYVYCTPLSPINNPLPASYIRQNDHTICVVLDFHLMLHDGYTAFYSADASICIPHIIVNGYIVHIFSVDTGETWYQRPFDIAADSFFNRSRIHSATDLLQQRTVRDFTCKLCGHLCFVGSHQCFKCFGPIFYENHTPCWDELVCDWPGIRLLEWSKEFLHAFRNSLHAGMKIKRDSLYALFNVKPPSAEFIRNHEKKLHGTPGRRARVFDSEQRRRIESFHRTGFKPYNTVDEWIRNDEVYRKHLINYLVNASSYFDPARYLLSNTCNLAYEVAIELGEIPMPVRSDMPQELVEFVFP